MKSSRAAIRPDFLGNFVCVCCSAKQIENGEERDGFSEAGEEENFQCGVVDTVWDCGFGLHSDFE